MKWKFTLFFRSSMFGAPSNNITKILMVGYGLPLLIVIIMGIGNELVILNLIKFN